MNLPFGPINKGWKILIINSAKIDTKNSGSKKILVAPLNWGLGHATRCVPVVNTLIDHGFKPVLAGDGESLALLKKEFPQLKNYQLPAYNIQYSKKGKYLKFKLLLSLPRIQKIIKKEKLEVEKIIDKEQISGIISDNRFGVFSEKLPSVYITHQVNVLSGLTSFFTSKIHQRIISKYQECWVPDFKGDNNLAGNLSQVDHTRLNLKYIGPLSRFENKKISVKEKKYQIMVLLSGPEPQRTLLEKQLLTELKDFPKKVLFIRGVISDKEKTYSKNKNIITVNYLLQKDLQKSIAESEIIISRSGYSSIMDLEVMQAKAFFIPTPGQQEQEYLATYLEKKGIAPYSNQDKFKINDLKKLLNYKGFKTKKTVREHNIPLTVFLKLV